MGVPQGSILGPILFNIFINDLLFSVNDTNICNFADDNTLYACDTNLDNILSRLNADINIVIQWFKCNSMVANPEKFQLMFLGTEDSNISLNIDGNIVKNSSIVKLLGVTIDDRLCFHPYIKDLCKKTNQKTKALLRIRKNLNQATADILCSSFILSTFNYCPLIWMFCGKQSNNLINSTHCRVLNARLDNFRLPFNDLLDETKSVNIHTKNLRLLLIEVYKSLNGLSPEFMRPLFQRKACHYEIRSGKNLVLPCITSSTNTNSFEFRAILAWNYIPRLLKEAQTLNDFKVGIENIDIYCKCKICS